MKTLSRLCLTVLLTSFVAFSFATPAFALDLSKPLAGDSRGCGSATTGPCPVSGIFSEFKDIYLMAIIIVASIALISFVMYSVKVLMAKDQPAAMQEGKKQLTNDVIVIILLIFFAVLFTTFFNALVKPQYNNFVKQFLSRVEEAPLTLFSTAFAADTTTQHLPNALVVNSVYDLGIIIYQLAMRWVLIPILIASWIWAGFAFIYARGSPDRLKYAKSRLYYSVIWTVILMFVLGLAYAFRGSFNQIFT